MLPDSMRLLRGAGVIQLAMGCATRHNRLLQSLLSTALSSSVHICIGTPPAAAAPVTEPRTAVECLSHQVPMTLACSTVKCRDSAECLLHSRAPSAVVCAGTKEKKRRRNSTTFVVLRETFAPGVRD